MRYLPWIKQSSLIPEYYQEGVDKPPPADSQEEQLDSQPNVTNQIINGQAESKDQDGEQVLFVLL